MSSTKILTENEFLRFNQISHKGPVSLARDQLELHRKELIEIIDNVLEREQQSKKP